MEVKNKNSKTIIIVVMLLIIIGLVCYILYSNFFNSNGDKKGNESNDINTTEEQTKSEAYNNSFLIVDSHRDDYPNYKYTIYLASNDYIDNGTKKELFSKNIISMSVFDKKIYYIDNTKKLYIHSVETDNIDSYDLDNTDINYNTAILPGKNNSIVMLTNGKGIIVNLKDRTHKTIDIGNRRGDGIYDEDHNILYYSTGNDIYKYDMLNNQSSLVEGVKGYPTFQDEKYVYIENETDGSEQIYSLNKSTLEIKNLNITDYNKYISSISLYEKVDDSLFILINNYDKLIEYKDDKETYVLEADYIKSINIGKQLYIGTATKESGYDVATVGDFDKFYVYNVGDSKLSNSDNQYVKELFNYYAVYNLY